MVKVRSVAGRVWLVGLVVLASCAKQEAAPRTLLVRLLSTDRSESSAALTEIDGLPDPARQELLPGLRCGLGSLNPLVRSNAACAIARIGPAAKALAPALRDQLKIEKEAEPRLWISAALTIVTHPLPAISTAPSSESASVALSTSAAEGDNTQLAQLLAGARAGTLTPANLQTLTNIMSSSLPDGKVPSASTLLSLKSSALSKIATPEMLSALKNYTKGYTGMVLPRQSSMTEAQVDEACRAQWALLQHIATTERMPVEKVLTYFVPSVQSQYRAMFYSFGSYLQDAFVPMNKVKSFKVMGRTAAYQLLDESNKPATIRFYQEDDGVWRVLFYDN
jgi:hypothetical protein